MRILQLIGLVACVMFITGCGSSVMIRGELKTQPSEGKALVTILRPTRFGGAIQFSVWDKEEFVGVVNARRYVQYEADPGEHLFLARAENWSLVKANLEAGKHYYMITRVLMGVWKARVALDPINKGDKVTDAQIQSWLKGMTPMKVDPLKKDAYVNPRIPDVRKGIALMDKPETKFKTMAADDNR